MFDLDCMVFEQRMVKGMLFVDVNAVNDITIFSLIHRLICITLYDRRFSVHRYINIHVYIQIKIYLETLEGRLVDKLELCIIVIQDFSSLDRTCKEWNKRKYFHKHGCVEWECEWIIWFLSDFCNLHIYFMLYRGMFWVKWATRKKGNSDGTSFLASIIGVSFNIITMILTLYWHFPRKKIISRIKFVRVCLMSISISSSIKIFLPWRVYASTSFCNEFENATSAIISPIWWLRL